MKYILVTGGVISGVGKGIISSCIGAILQGLGLNITIIKIDPYINVDAGTFSPHEHGEVFVLDDGSEVDLDCGNYERFLDVRLNSTNNITTGKIFQKVIGDERKGQYLGKTVQYVPHITNAIQEWVKSVAVTKLKHNGGKEIEPEICVIELGGTIGDIESMAFTEAFRQMHLKLGKDNFLVVHVSLILEPKSTGDQKTKPTQRSIKDICSLGLNPDIIMCRSETQLAPEVKTKVADYGNVSEEQVISVPDMPLYSIPQYLVNQNLIQVFCKHLNLNIPSIPVNVVKKWNDLAEKTKNCTQDVTIALVGKYVKFSDAYASVNKALGHAALSLNAKLNLVYIESTNLEEKTERSNKDKYETAWKVLRKANGIIVPGGFDIRGTEGKIAAIGYARLNNIPFLGICLGFQCGVIEFARNVIKLPDANSTEFDDRTKHPVIIDMPEHNQGAMGGTMRLGLKTTYFTQTDSIIYKLYGERKEIDERHRHRYEVNPDYAEQIEKNGLSFVGKDSEKVRMEIFELKDHPYFVGVQFHPEFLSRPTKPSPPFVGLITFALNSSS